MAAFQTKSRETTGATTRPAFQMNKTPKTEVHSASSPATATYFGYAPAMPNNGYYEEEEEVEIGVGTAIVACAVSLALGFGLGYGT